MSCSPPPSAGSRRSPEAALLCDLAAALGRLAAAEYHCCSFGGYTIVIDGTGLRLEVRMPIEAAEAIAAAVGLPHASTPVTEAR